VGITDLIRRRNEADGTSVPTSIKDRLNRGRTVMLKDSADVKLGVKFWNGEHYWVKDGSGVLRQLSTGVAFGDKGGKPPHRVRQRFNFIRQLVEGKVSAATQRVPSYECNPSTTEPDDQDAARLSEKVALFGYDQWRLRDVTTKVVTNALVQREGFAFPYWDQDVGPYEESVNENGNITVEGRGEVKVEVLGATEVYWEPGMDFLDSPWYAIERAKYVGDVAAMEGFDGKELFPDASTSDNPLAREGEKLVMVTDYLERPSKKHPKGRRIITANERVIVPLEDYPLKDHDGNVLDEPCIHKLSYVVDPTKDRDMSLVSILVDPQRTINDCWNKLLEYKNRGMNPQMIAPVNSLVNKPDDTPGAVKFYRPTGMNPPQWETPIQIPPALMQILEMAITQMRILAADVDVQAEPDLAARTAQAAIEQSRQRWQSFLGDLAEFHSRLMRHCLMLVQCYYEDESLLTVQGTFGPDYIPSFRGAQLLGQVDVRVSPGSLEQMTKTDTIQQAMAFSERGWISGPEAMSWINGGVADTMYKSWELDVGRANRVIQAIRRNPEDFLELYPPITQKVPMVDPITAAPALDAMGKPLTQDVEVPWFMPRQGVDQVPVHKTVMSAFMKTTEWDRMDPVQREYGQMYFDALLQIEADEQMAMMNAQMNEAQQLGMDNASKSSKVPAMPDQPNMDGPPVTQSSILNA
jgi:hypothetical protein